MACSTPPSAAEPRAATTSHETASDGDATVDDGTLYLKVDQQAVFYDNADGNAIAVTVCEDGADPSVLDRIRGMSAQPHLVLEQPDGTVDARLSEMPRHLTDVYYCGEDGHGDAWLFQLWQQDVGFLKSFDLSGAMVNALAGKRVGCEGGFALSHDIELEVSGFRMEGGVLRQPDITLGLDGESAGEVHARCFLQASTPTMVAFAGPVPILYELSAQVALDISLSKATTLHARIGSQGGELTTDDVTFTVSPSIELGVVFYHALGAYVAAAVPITIAPRPPCTPEVTAGVQFSIEGRAGIIDAAVGGLSFTKALSAELSTPVLGPFTLAESSCN
jgi:hypothetical protein